jgi:predicted amidophosphoribosyltransferase
MGTIIIGYNTAYAQCFNCSNNLGQFFGVLNCKVCGKRLVSELKKQEYCGIQKEVIKDENQEQYMYEDLKDTYIQSIYWALMSKIMSDEK